MEELSNKVDDHEGRIRTLETSNTVLVTKLNLMIGILAAIAVMVGGSLVTYLLK